MRIGRPHADLRLEMIAGVQTTRASQRQFLAVHSPAFLTPP